MKKYFLKIIVGLASMVAYIGIYPSSWVSLYQPEIPEDLIK
ncbi:cyclic lactone autoinducer peptide [Desulfohalotomaculum tongense]|nr:cyclic lactone autoinducer peptide [Desulforadius tongensis]MBM7854676.1 cyclic lactone autoinducer peptide [Desulforadius tongensis]